MLMTRLRTILTVIGFALLTSSAGSRASSVVPADLRSEGREDPLGVDVTAPALSWKLAPAAPARGLSQTAYRVLVATSTNSLEEGKADLWDSGRVSSARTVEIPYGGKPLGSAEQVFWKVQVWDQAGMPSAWSLPAYWTMGILKSEDWHGASWISAPLDTPPTVDGPMPKYETLLLRRKFPVKSGLRRALLNVCGLGQYEMTLNGKKAGNYLQTPGWTKYDKTCLYDTYDITSQLHAGYNAAGMMLGSGMYLSHKGRYNKGVWTFGPLQAIALIRLEYEDGTVETVATDAQWRAASGPITFSSPYGGEDYDARLLPQGWDGPAFDDSKWDAARIGNGPGGRLAGLSCAASPVGVIQVLKPVSTKEIGPGTTVYDLGQNASIMPSIVVDGPPGSSVRITPSELVKPSGEIDDTMSNGQAFWTYTLRGGGTESWFPKFFYRGARYLRVEAIAPGGGEMLPWVKSIEGVVVHSTAKPVGEFACSSDLYNRIDTIVRWAQRSNMMSILTDCPTREKLGWLEEDHLNGPALRYNFGLEALFSKIENDMADSQLADGLVPNIAPEYLVFGGPTRNAFGDSPEWSSAFLLVPWQQYQFTGSTALLRAHYDGMKRYVAYLEGRAQGNIVDYGLGDWYDIGPKEPGYAQLTPRALTATAFFYYDTWILGQAAKALGQADDAAHYAALAEQIRAAFNQRFLNPQTNEYATGSQTANSIPLVMNLAPTDARAAILANVVADVRTKGLTAGDVGYRYLLQALAEDGRSDVIFDMNNQPAKPGYAMQLARGATSLTEAWDARRESSQNHFMLGQINEWFYRELAGIQSDPDGPGFAKIIIKPSPVGDITRTRASYDSAHGRIVSEWKRDGARLKMDVAVPPNTTAQIYVPTTDAKTVTEGGHPAGQAEDVRYLRTDGADAVFGVGSGAYEFESNIPQDN
jgi:alpha-L-rhamnosidase